MPAFVRQIGSYALVFVLGAVLYATTFPAKVVVATTEAPANVRSYMEAYCALDADYLAEWTSPLYVTLDQIMTFVAEQRAEGAGCKDLRYMGAFGNTSHIFTVTLTLSGSEQFFVLTFDGDLVINIE